MYIQKIMELYQEIQKDIEVKFDQGYESLVHPGDAVNTPIHNWYRFKEGFSPRLLGEVINHCNVIGEIRLLDPFCGSGTTLLSAAFNPDINLKNGLGIEVSPFIHFMANTKLNFHKVDKNIVEEFIHFLGNINLKNEDLTFDIPQLSTIYKAYSYSTLNELLFLKYLLKTHLKGDIYEYNFLKLAFASILEEISCMKKSGRALKVVRPIQDYNVKDIFLKKTKSMLNDISCSIPTPNIDNIQIINNDVRNAELELDKNEKFNLVIFSPPYLNHFDYSEVYKIELWMLDFIKNPEEFRNLRFKTFRSHPSVKFKQTELYKEYGSVKIKNIIDYLNTAHKQEVFFNSIKGYIDDMYLTFGLLNNVTSDDAVLACVVANSLFGSKEQNNLMPVATDLLISEIAKDVGFDIKEIKVTRRLTRRGVRFSYGRESIIYFKKRPASKQLHFPMQYAK